VKVSFPGGVTVSLFALNLQKLLGRGSSLSFNAQIACNGHSFLIRALSDTGADGFVYIDTQLALQAAKAFGQPVIRLEKEVPTRGFDDHPGKPITHAIELTLMIDGRVQRCLPMLIADLGKHDLILGREWFAEYEVLPDCAKRRLIWPEESSLQEEVASQLSVALPRTILRRPAPTSEHQRAADRRDQLFEKVDRPSRCEPPRTAAGDRKQALAKMERALQGVQPLPSTPKERQTRTP